MIDRYVPISEAISRILIQGGINPQKITTVRSDVDPRPFQTWRPEQAKLNLADDIGFDSFLPLIANVAYHTPQKGMSTLIRGLSLLRDHETDFNCVLV